MTPIARQHQGFPQREAVLLMGGQGGERWPAGTLARRGKPENSAAQRRVLPTRDRSSGRQDVPVAPPSVRGADNALARAARTVDSGHPTLEWACHPVDQ